MNYRELRIQRRSRELLKEARMYFIEQGKRYSFLTEPSFVKRLKEECYLQAQREAEEKESAGHLKDPGTVAKDAWMDFLESQVKRQVGKGVGSQRGSAGSQLRGALRKHSGVGEGKRPISTQQSTGVVAEEFSRGQDVIGPFSQCNAQPQQAPHTNGEEAGIAIEGALDGHEPHPSLKKPSSAVFERTKKALWESLARRQKQASIGKREIVEDVAAVVDSTLVEYYEKLMENGKAAVPPKTSRGLSGYIETELAHLRNRDKYIDVKNHFTALGKAELKKKGIALPTGL